jgi:hypothetical protein
MVDTQALIRAAAVGADGNPASPADVMAREIDAHAALPEVQVQVLAALANAVRARRRGRRQLLSSVVWS